MLWRLTERVKEMLRIGRDPKISNFSPSKVTNFPNFKTSELWNARKMAKGREISQIKQDACKPPSTQVKIRWPRSQSVVIVAHASRSLQSCKHPGSRLGSRP